MEEVKSRRTKAKSQYTRVENALRKLLTNPESLQETIERKFQDLRTKWQELQDSHDEYAPLVATNDEEEEKEEEWINEICERFNEMEVDTDKCLQKFKKDKAPKVSQTEAKSSAPMVQKNSTELKEDANTVPTIVKPKEDKKTVEQQEEYSSTIQQKEDCSTIQVERLKVGKFNGEIRKYPGFRDLFKKYIEPKCKESEKAFVLREYLEEAVKVEVANVEDDLDLLWQRLDTKYGNRRKYTDTILADLAKTSQGGSKAALDLINTVEKAYQDLRKIHLEHEMFNSYIISMIEKKLPEEMRTDWVKSIAEDKKVDSEIVFIKLMKFLDKWRNIIEYDESAIRKAPEKKTGATHYAGLNKTKSNSEVCWLHEDGKHPIWKCNLFRIMPVGEKVSLIEKKEACKACLEIDCEGAKNPDDCKRQFKCKISGCGKAHNLLIHQ